MVFLLISFLHQAKRKVLLTQVIPCTPLIRTVDVSYSLYPSDKNLHPPIRMLTQVIPYTPPKNLHTPHVRTTLPCFERSSLPAEPFPCASHSPSSRSSLPAGAEIKASRNRKTRPILDNPPAKFARNAVSRQDFQMPYKSSTPRQSFTNFLPLHSPLHLGSRQEQQQLNK